jgi:hypothetical protein
MSLTGVMARHELFLGGVFLCATAKDRTRRQLDELFLGGVFLVGDHASQWAAIAAIARAHGASVATRNTDDYDGCEVAVIDPWAPAKVTR